MILTDNETKVDLRMFADPAKLATKDNVEAAIDGVRGLLKPFCGGSGSPA